MIQINISNKVTYTLKISSGEWACETDEIRTEGINVYKCPIQAATGMCEKASEASTCVGQLTNFQTCTYLSGEDCNYQNQLDCPYAGKLIS